MAGDVYEAASSLVLTAIYTDQSSFLTGSGVPFEYLQRHDAWLFLRVWRQMQKISTWQRSPGSKHHRLPNPWLPARNANACAQDTNPDDANILTGKGLAQTSSSSQSTREMPPSKLQVHPDVLWPKTPRYLYIANACVGRDAHSDGPRPWRDWCQANHLKTC